MRRPVVLIVLVAIAVVIMAIAFVILFPRLAERTPEPPTVEPTPEAIDRNNRGVGLMGRYEYENARQIFADLVREQPDWLDVRVNLAIATLNRQHEGDERAALNILDEVLQADPTHLRAQYTSGLLRLYLDEPDRAMEHFRYVADADPSDAHAAYYVAQSHAQRGEFEQANEWYARAIETDVYLRSAYYGKFQTLQRLGEQEQAMEMLEVFQRLADNPRAQLVEFVYTRMGPKGEAMAVGLPDPETIPPPQGPVFADAQPLLINGEDFTWRVRQPDRPVSITIGEFIFIPGVLDEPGVYNAVCIPLGEGRFALDPDHVLAGIPDVNAALWGDYDNDGFTDLYLLRRGPNMLLRRVAHAEPVIPGSVSAGGWIDVTEETGTSGGDYDSVNGLFFDADHDGDLDIFIVNADGPNELLNNNLDGTFTPIAHQQGIAGDGRASQQVIAADLERDRDLDIIIINAQPPHEVYLNDRLWQYERGTPERFPFINEPIVAAVAGDVSADGQAELFTLDLQGNIRRWMPDDDDIWRDGDVTTIDAFDPATAQLAIVDVNGDARQELIVSTADGWKALRLHVADDADAVVARGEAAVSGWTPAVLDATRGPAMVAVGGDEDPQPIIRYPGPGRHEFATLGFTGREDPGQAMRSNASGIGTYYAARIGSRWVAGITLPSHSGPGQSLRPVAIGLAGHSKIDFVHIDWSDGVFQSEIDLAAGEHHLITETQRQLASCPILFAWNGERYEFISDVLGVAGIGFAVGPGEYAPSRPWENFLMPIGVMQPKDGRYVLKLGEPMEEVLYLDSAGLVVYDVPPGWSMTVDERMNISGPEPTGEPRFFQRSMLPSRAVNDRGEDITAVIREANYEAAPVGEHDLRFLGRLERDNVITLTFPEALDSPGNSDGEPLLIADGWIEYPYSQTMFAAWQAGADYRPPTIEARGSDGQWHVVLEQFGYMAGMPRQMSVPLPDLPEGTTELRIATNQEIYWDRIKVAWAEPPPAEVVRRDLELAEATLKRTGFAQRTLMDQRRPWYDYDNRPPLWDTRHLAGWYTRFGPVEQFIREQNHALAIIGPGEEVHMEFIAPSESPPDGWTRYHVFKTTGWCKDMDLYTLDPDTLEPLPGEHTPQREQLHERYNTRFRSGR